MQQQQQHTTHPITSDTSYYDYQCALERIQTCRALLAMTTGRSQDGYTDNDTVLRYNELLLEHINIAIFHMQHIDINPPDLIS